MIPFRLRLIFCPVLTRTVIDLRVRVTTRSYMISLSLESLLFCVFAFSYAFPQVIRSASFDNAFQLSCSHAGTRFNSPEVVPYVLIVAICTAVFHPPQAIVFLS